MLRSASAYLRQALERLVDVGQRPFRIGAGGAHQFRREPLAIGEKLPGQMAWNDVLMSSCLGEAVGRLNETTRPLREIPKIHPSSPLQPAPHVVLHFCNTRGSQV